MLKNIKHIWLIGIIFFAFVLFFGATHFINAQTPTPIPLSGNAWGAAKDTPCTTSPCEGSGIGWIIFRGTGYGVDIVGDTVVGTAKSPLLGWLDFGGLSGFPISNASYCGSTGNCNAHFEGDTLFGWARFRANKGNNSDWDGWIALHGPNFGIQKVPFGTGQSSLAGNAWGSNGFGPGWIHFPNQAIPDPKIDPPLPPNPTGCTGVCTGGTAAPLYSCSGVTNNDRSVTWTISIDNPDAGATYQYAFASALNNYNYNQSQGNNATFTTGVYANDTNQASMKFSVYRTDTNTTVADNFDCASTNLGVTTVASPISIKAQKTGGVGLSQITVSLGDSFTILPSIGVYKPESCSVNGTPVTDFGPSKPITASASQNYILSCLQTNPELNGGAMVTESTYVHVVDNGQTQEF